jgi:DNA-directed RNA polymerase specialized sigma24 family protein
MWVCGDLHDARDVLLETNLVLWQKIGEFEPGSNFGAWARKIAYFQALAFLRDRKRKANSALRVQASCMAMGQAAGATAALAVQRNTPPLNVPLKDIRTLLARHGTIIPKA